jgi:hypothetical protein
LETALPSSRDELGIIKGGTKVIHLATALILILTIVLGMAFGVASGYLIIASVLNAFAHKPKTQPQAAALATQGVSGD